MRYALLTWLALAAFARGQDVMDVMNREIPRLQERYADIVPSIGRILVVDAKYFGGLPVSVAIDREYAIIRKLPEPARAEFFFVIATKIRLDAHYLEEALEMISKDCPAAFERRVAQFLEEFGPATGHDEVKRAKYYVEWVRKYRKPAPNK